MAEKNYKINEAIKVTYQAADAATGLTVTMEIYDETGAKDGVNFPDVTMSETGSTGRYTGSFTPDAGGEWTVHISDTANGNVVKQFSVGNYNVDDVGTAIDSLNDVSTTEVNAEVDTALADYDGPTKAELDSAISDVQVDIAGLEISTPPMIG